MLENQNNLCIGELASVLYRKYQSYVKKGVKVCGIRFSECVYLIKIPDHKLVTQSYIANRLFCDNAVVTRSLQTLEKKGFVKRYKSPDDKRAVMVSLTAKGMDAKQLGIKTINRWKEHMMADISADKAETLMQTLKLMLKKTLTTTT